MRHGSLDVAGQFGAKITGPLVALIPALSDAIRELNQKVQINMLFDPAAGAMGAESGLHGGQ